MKKFFLLIAPFLLTACGPLPNFGPQQAQWDQEQCDQPQQQLQSPQVKPADTVPDDPHHHFIPGHCLPGAGFPEQRISPRHPVY